MNRKLLIMVLGAVLSGALGISAPAAGAGGEDGTVVARFNDRVAGPFRWRAITCWLDEKVACSAGVKSGQLTLFTRKLPPGKHTVRVEAAYDGHSGPFTYMRGYHYYVRMHRTFTVRSGQTTRVLVTAVDQPSPTARFEDRLGLVVDILPGAQAPRTTKATGRVG
jgi:hypothetical protein